MTHDAQLLANAAAAVALLVVLVSMPRIHAFLALLLAAVFLGLLAGIAAGPLLSALQQGVGHALGFVTEVLGLGAMLGRMLTAPAGAERIALTLVDRFGAISVHWAILCAACVVGIPPLLRSRLRAAGTAGVCRAEWRAADESPGLRGLETTHPRCRTHRRRRQRVAQLPPGVTPPRTASVATPRRRTHRQDSSAETVANLTFGGPKKNRLFIFASTSVYSMCLNNVGAQSP